ncbi:MAG: UDP-N-acetylmuramate--L-alanine ligase [Desulfobacteraceae bacterium]|jgi:UDP-N-acetylmuramate--alanine ligase
MKTFGKVHHIHFVGIGGIGMSGIAELLLNLGYEVSGSDIRESSVTRRLAAMGARVFSGHRAEHAEGADVVVYSSAVPTENPEVRAATERFVPVIPRAEMLAELMRLKYGVAVAGAHGKTTTTSMIASILTSADLDPTVVIGGRLDIWGGSNAKLGQGDILVAESDESDGSFMLLSPTIAVVTNMDYEHIEHYGTMDNLRTAFVDFVNKIPFYGSAVLCLDNEEIQGILPRLRKRYLTYGMTSQADVQAKEVEMQDFSASFEILHQDRSLGRIVVGMPGRHNVLNALAAVAVGLELEVDLEDIRGGLRSLGGLARRFQLKGERQGVLVMDDYGHHPTEIVHTLETARACWPNRRLVVVFQPHRYSRTRALYDRFVLSFNQADLLIIAPIYGASEAPIEGVDAAWLYRGVKEHGHREVVLGEDLAGIQSYLEATIRSGDVLLTLGAGDVYRVGEALLETLEPGTSGAEA